MNPLRIITICTLAVAFFVHARESVLPVRGPESYALLGGIVELLDDVYSIDMELRGEFAPCNCFSVYGDFSYRFSSYEYDVDPGRIEQRHELLNLQVNGFNESYLGFKIAPYSFWGVEVNWRLPPGEGSQVNRFHRLGVEPFGLYPFSKDLLIGVAASYYVFLESENYQPGDELGLKGSMQWRLAWDYNRSSGWLLDYVFLYRWRVQESRNLKLAKSCQKMDDLDRGFRLRVDAGRYFAIAQHSLGVALFYEMNRGNLFGFETGHSVGLYTKFML